MSQRTRRPKLELLSDDVGDGRSLRLIGWAEQESQQPRKAAPRREESHDLTMLQALAAEGFVDGVLER